jgi:hypothetical protein
VSSELPQAGVAAKVIGVSGPPGSGKTTLVGALAQRLGDAAVLSMDHYQRMTELPIEDIARWAARGADLDELPMPHLADHLRLLKQGRSVVDPATGATIVPRRYILFETHFGRSHSGTGGQIDWLVWLDTPPDLALARNLRGFLKPLQPSMAVDSIHEELRWIEGYLANYEAVVSSLVRLQLARVRPRADQVIGPDLAVQDAAQEVCRLAALARE